MQAPAWRLFETAGSLFSVGFQVCVGLLRFSTNYLIRSCGVRHGDATLA